MTPSNDNRPAKAAASRVLPIRGRVAPDGRVRLWPESGKAPPGVHDGVIRFPNDPREA